MNILIQFFHQTYPSKFLYNVELYTRLKNYIIDKKVILLDQIDLIPQIKVSDSNNPDIIKIFKYNDVELVYSYVIEIIQI